MKTILEAVDFCKEDCVNKCDSYLETNKELS